MKPLDGLLVNDLHAELRARGMPIAGKLKDELQNDLVETLRGARVPTVLVQNPSQSLSDLNLHYEVLDCEPLHDIKGYLLILLLEIPLILPPTSLSTDFRNHPTKRYGV